MKEQSSYNHSIDIVKFIATVLIMGSHALPLFHSNVLNRYYGQWFFRWCVPFFFVSAGYFFEGMLEMQRRNYICRIGYIYVISTAFYVPFILKDALAETSIYGLVGNLLNSVIWGYNHLWYLSALFVSSVAFFFLNKWVRKKTWIFLLLLGVGIFLDKYYEIINVQWLNSIAKFQNHFGGGRHALLFALPLMVIGSIIKKHEIMIVEVLHMWIMVILLIIFSTFSYYEIAWVLDKMDEKFYMDISVFNWIPGVIIFIMEVKIDSFIRNKRGEHFYSINSISSRTIRKISDIVYIIHPAIIWIITKIFNIRYGLRFFICLVICVLISFIIYSMNKKLKVIIL